MEDLYDATVAALGGDGGEGVNQPAPEPPAEPADTPPANAGEPVATPEGEGTPAPVTPSSDEQAPAPDGEGDRGPIPYDRFQEVVRKRQELETQNAEYQAQLQQFQQVQPLLEVLQQNPDAQQYMLRLASGQVEQPQQEATAEDYVNYFLAQPGVDAEDPAVVAGVKAQAIAQYNADRFDAYQRQQAEQSQARQVAAQQAQAQQYWGRVQSEAVTAVKAANLPDNPLITSGVLALFQTHNGQKPIADCVTELKGMFDGYHSAQMAHYAKQKQTPQPVIQGGGGGAPTAAPPDPTRKKSYMEEVAETAALLRGN